MESKKVVKVPAGLESMTPEERRKVAEQLWETLSSQMKESRERDPNMVALDEILDQRTKKDSTKL